MGRLKNYIKAYRRPLLTDRLERFNFFPLSYEPPVIFTYVGWDLSNLFHMASELDAERVVFLVGFTRHTRRWHQLYLRRQLRAFAASYPQHEVLLMANSEDELQGMRQAGFTAHYVANNAYVREDQFDVLPGRSRRFDAIMNARAAPWKRLELACKVESLAMVTIKADADYFDEMREVLGHAYWANIDEAGEFQYLAREDIGELVNESGAGLILSAYEGNNRVSVEYLLCGVPVVSTPSKGGREAFFELDYARIVPPDPDAIADAVDYFNAHPVDPAAVRARTLEKMVGFRKRLARIVEDSTAGRVSLAVENWLDFYPDNMTFKCTAGNFATYFNERLLQQVPFAKSEHNLKAQHPDLYQLYNQRVAG